MFEKIDSFDWFIFGNKMTNTSEFALVSLFQMQGAFLRSKFSPFFSVLYILYIFVASFLIYGSASAGITLNVNLRT